MKKQVIDDAENKVTQQAVFDDLEGKIEQRLRPFWAEGLVGEG